MLKANVQRTYCQAIFYTFLIYELIQSYELGISFSVMSNSLQTSWSVAHQAPLSMVFSRQGYWRG